jgi:hypothetical protein
MAIRAAVILHAINNTHEVLSVGDTLQPTDLPQATTTDLGAARFATAGEITTGTSTLAMLSVAGAVSLVAQHSAAAAPTTAVNPATPTTYFGANTAYLGNPVGWKEFPVGFGHKIPYYT